jgi:hypothetical protein
MGIIRDYVLTLNKIIIMRQGIEDKISNHLQPNLGITMAARQISNIVPVAQHT